jgi:hypothetical protein
MYIAELGAGMSALERTLLVENADPATVQAGKSRDHLIDALGLTDSQHDVSRQHI